MAPPVVKYRIQSSIAEGGERRYLILSVADDVAHKRHKKNPFDKKYLSLALAPFDIADNKGRSRTSITKDDVEEASTNVHLRAELIRSMRDVLSKKTIEAVRELKVTSREADAKPATAARTANGQEPVGSELDRFKSIFGNGDVLRENEKSRGSASRRNKFGSFAGVSVEQTNEKRVLDLKIDEAVASAIGKIAENTALFLKRDELCYNLSASSSGNLESTISMVLDWQENGDAISDVSIPMYFDFKPYKALVVPVEEDLLDDEVANDDEASLEATSLFTIQAPLPNIEPEPVQGETLGTGAPSGENVAFDDICDFDDFELVDKLVAEHAAKKAASISEAQGSALKEMVGQGPQPTRFQVHEQVQAVVFQSSHPFHKHAGFELHTNLTEGHQEAACANAGEHETVPVGKLVAEHAAKKAASMSDTQPCAQKEMVGEGPQSAQFQGHEQVQHVVVQPSHTFQDHAGTEMHTHCAEGHQGAAGEHDTVPAVGSLYKPQFGKRKSRTDKVMPTSTNLPEEDPTEPSDAQPEQDPSQVFVDNSGPADVITQMEDPPIHAQGTTNILLLDRLEVSRLRKADSSSSVRQSKQIRDAEKLLMPPHCHDEILELDPWEDINMDRDMFRLSLYKSRIDIVSYREKLFSDPSLLEGGFDIDVLTVPYPKMTHGQLVPYEHDTSSYEHDTSAYEHETASIAPSEEQVHAHLEDDDNPLELPPHSLNDHLLPEESNDQDFWDSYGWDDIPSMTHQPQQQRSSVAYCEPSAGPSAGGPSGAVPAGDDFQVHRENKELDPVAVAAREHTHPFPVTGAVPGWQSGSPHPPGDSGRSFVHPGLAADHGPGAEEQSGMHRGDYLVPPPASSGSDVQPAEPCSSPSVPQPLKSSLQPPVAPPAASRASTECAATGSEAVDPLSTPVHPQSSMDSSIAETPTSAHARGKRPRLQDLIAKVMSRDAYPDHLCDPSSISALSHKLEKDIAVAHTSGASVFGRGHLTQMLGGTAAEGTMTSQRYFMMLLNLAHHHNMLPPERREDVLCHTEFLLRCGQGAGPSCVELSLSDQSESFV